MSTAHVLVSFSSLHCLSVVVRSGENLFLAHVLVSFSSLHCFSVVVQSCEDLFPECRYHAGALGMLCSAGSLSCGLLLLTGALSLRPVFVGPWTVGNLRFQRQASSVRSRDSLQGITVSVFLVSLQERKNSVDRVSEQGQGACTDAGRVTHQGLRLCLRKTFPR